MGSSGKMYGAKMNSWKGKGYSSKGGDSYKGGGYYAYKGKGTLYKGKGYFSYSDGGSVYKGKGKGKGYCVSSGYGALCFRLFPCDPLLFHYSFSFFDRAFGNPKHRSQLFYQHWDLLLWSLQQALCSKWSPEQPCQQGLLLQDLPHSQPHFLLPSPHRSQHLDRRLFPQNRQLKDQLCSRAQILQAPPASLT